jgi:hypothetical protein
MEQSPTLSNMSAKPGMWGTRGVITYLVIRDARVSENDAREEQDLSHVRQADGESLHPRLRAPQEQVPEHESLGPRVGGGGTGLAQNPRRQVRRKARVLFALLAFRQFIQFGYDSQTQAIQRETMGTNPYLGSSSAICGTW